ncbi:hypothetical protein [Desertibacillus haloalkaliphilus]|uniref:hypothetical protein n=1 Tax=Desertibacillus haloalkaliphilus TaxID=1328930 RepID=UPI003F689B52
MFIKADVSNPDEVKHYVTKTVEEFGTTEFFQQCRVSGNRKFFLEKTIEEIDQVININLMRTLYGVRYVGGFTNTK